MSQSHRVLFVEDDPKILGVYQEIFCGREDCGMEEKGASLFGFAGNPARENFGNGYDVVLASCGEEGVYQVEKASRENKPFSAAFVDMRMPGINGAETIRRMWKADPFVKAVVVTAYSEYSPEEIVKTVGRDDVFYLQKPFNPKEIRQFARVLTRQWDLERETKMLFDILETSRWKLEDLNQELEARVEERNRQLLNVNERLKEEATRRAKLEKGLRLAQKMEALATLARGIAHDFNNTLSLVIGQAELASMDLDPDDPVQNRLRQIVLAGRRSQELVRQIYAFSSRRETEKKLMDAGRLVREVVEFLRPMLPFSVELKANVQTGCSSVLADASQLHQVLMNLCLNGWQAMEEGTGTLEIDVRETVVETVPSEAVGEPSPGRFVRIAVKDDGSGMDEETRELIFDPFFTTKAEGEGTGLGLAVVYAIVKSHKGWLTVSGAPGRGTEFALYLPCPST